MKEMNAEHQDGYCYGDPSALECMYNKSRDEKEEKEENIRPTLQQQLQHQ